MSYKWLNSPKDARCIIDSAVENIGMLLFVNVLAGSSPHTEKLLSVDIVERLIKVSNELHAIATEIDNGN